MYVLGYLPRDGRVYVADKDVNILSYGLSLSVVEYQTLVLRGELDAANEMLADIPSEQKNKIARFLEGQNYKELALEVATDPEHRFELALALQNLDIALSLAREADAEHKWKIVGDTALASWDIRLAEECFKHAKDLGSLLLLYSATSNRTGLAEVAEQASSQSVSANNIAFQCYWLLGDVESCVELLSRTNRKAEAVLFAQTYKPSKAASLARAWREGLEKDSKGKVARLLGMPPHEEGDGDGDMFPEWNEWLQLEKDGGSAVRELPVAGAETKAEALPDEDANGDEEDAEEEEEEEEEE